MDTTSDSNRVTHSGTGGEFFVIFLVNFLLTVVTLGIYSFWAKARSRRYLWSHSSFDGEQFEYDGTGRETFIGFLKAVGIMILGAVVLGTTVYFLMTLFKPLAMLLLVLAYLFVVMVAPFAARYGAQRYLLSRTRYRAVRFAMSGSAIRYGFMAFGQSILVILSLGFYAPFASIKLHAFRTRNSFYGNEPVHFDGVGKDLFLDFAIAWLLTIPTLGLVWFWYAASSARYKARHTQLGGLRFNVTYTGGQMLWLSFTNLLLVVFTLGLAMPWAAIRNMRFVARNTQIAGNLNYDAVVQAAEKATATGEGFADALDVGLSI